MKEMKTIAFDISFAIVAATILAIAQKALPAQLLTIETVDSDRQVLVRK